VQISSGTILFGRWVTQILLVYPGILYDSLYAATYLGMTRNYFVMKFRKDIRDRKYRGVFSRSHKSRWWKSSLAEMVVAHPKARKHKTLRTWELAPEIFAVPKAAQPRCLVCGKRFPETVAYDKDDPTRRGPAHLSCSEPDPNRQALLYFEPFRVFIE
jgi:hypothetical protein